MDNTSTNNTPMEYVTKDLVDQKIVYDSWQNRLRCHDHIINLAVCIFLFKKHLNANDVADRAVVLRAGPSILELNI